MLTRQQRWCTRAAVALVLCLTPLSATAQDRQQPSLLTDVAKRVLLDPTTYAPAILEYDATMRDWNSSQAFFQNGFAESNWHFTVTGRANDTAVGYEAGRRQILHDALMHLQVTAVHNVASGVIEHVLIDRYPERRRLLRTIGWIERMAFSSWTAYQLASPHYRQWRENERLARQLGYR